MGKLILVMMFLTVLMMVLSFQIGRISGQHSPAVILRLDFNTALLDSAMTYNNIELCSYAKGDSVYAGSFYFERGGQNCSVFNIPFRTKYVTDWLDNKYNRGGQ